MLISPDLFCFANITQVIVHRQYFVPVRFFDCFVCLFWCVGLFVWCFLGVGLFLGRGGVCGINNTNIRILGEAIRNHTGKSKMYRRSQ